MAWYHHDYAPYVPVRERQAQARREAKKLAKNGRKLQPVEIDGRAIAATFWGKAWCEHLERYSDFSNRLPRGRTYVRNGSVIDLELAKGEVRALVSGSELYQVKIGVEALAPRRWKALVGQCTGKIDSVVELLSGRLSDAVMSVLCDPKRGLFPGSNELDLSCSCPDYAHLCKHLAAVLYGVGARLDRQPELLFLLRGVDQLDLLGEAAGGALAAKSAGADELHGGELESIFGIELDAGAPEKRGRKKSAAPKAQPRPQRAGGGRRRARASASASTMPSDGTVSQPRAGD